jgi:hypothetical protein
VAEPKSGWSLRQQRSGTPQPKEFYPQISQIKGIIKKNFEPRKARKNTKVALLKKNASPKKC